MTKVWYKLYHFPGEEEIPGNGGIVRVEAGCTVTELRNEIYRFHERALGTSSSPTDLYLYPFGTYMPVADASTQLDGDTLVSTLPSTTQAKPLLVLVAESSANLSKRKLEDWLEATQLAFSESKASQTLKAVKHLKCCFLCDGNKDIEASHVIHFFQDANKSIRSCQDFGTNHELDEGSQMGATFRNPRLNESYLVLPHSQSCF